MENFIDHTPKDALDWDTEIEDTAPDFIVVPEGEYQFKVAAMERGHFPGSKKIGPCFKATLTLKIYVPDGICTLKTDIYLSSLLKWKIAQFFRAINMLQEGGKTVTDWDHVVGKIGRAKVKVRTYTTNAGEERTVNVIDTFLPFDASRINLMEGFTELNSAEELPF